MPFPFPWYTFAHGRLERPKLRNRLQTLERFDGLPQKFCIRVILLRLALYSFQQNRIFIKMFRWSIQKVLQIK